MPGSGKAVAARPEPPAEGGQGPPGSARRWPAVYAAVLVAMLSLGLWALLYVVVRWLLG